MRDPLRSLCTFKSLVAPPSPRAAAKLDPRWRGVGPERGAAERAAEPPERQTRLPAASETRAPSSPGRAASSCASHRDSGLGLSGPFGGETPHQPHPSGAGGRERGAPDPVDCGLGAQCSVQGLAHCRALWTLGGWMGGRKDGEVAGRLPRLAYRPDGSVGGGATATIIVAAAT